MSLELAHLVISRAPLKGIRFHVLLYLGLKANDIDAVHASGPDIAFAMRLSKWRSQAAITELHDAGWITRMRYGRRENPNQGYFLVSRDKLLDYPLRNRAKRKLAGISVYELDQRAISDLGRIQRVHADIREKFQNAAPGTHAKLLQALINKG